MRSRASSWRSCLPEWWFVRYVFVFLIFTSTSIVLIAGNVAPATAVWVPVTLSGASIGVLHALKRITTRTVGIHSWRV